MNMPFGPYAGRSIEAVPKNYLRSLLRQGVQDQRLRAEIIRVLGRLSPKEVVALWQQANAELREEIESLKAKLNEYEVCVKDWYLEIIRIAHPDKGGELQVMQMINELKER